MFKIAFRHVFIKFDGTLIAVGLVWYFNRRRNREEAEPDEKTEQSSDAVREEEFIETTHYKHF